MTKAETIAAGLAAAAEAGSITDEHPEELWTAELGQQWEADCAAFVAAQLAVLRGQRRITDATPPEVIADWETRLRAAYERLPPPPEEPEPPEPAEEWVDIQLFIAALYALAPAETVAAVLQSPEALKSGIAGLALLSSNAAPNGMINLLDARVADFAGLLGLTVETVKAKLAELQNPPEPPDETEVEP